MCFPEDLEDTPLKRLSGFHLNLLRLRRIIFMWSVIFFKPKIEYESIYRTSGYQKQHKHSFITVKICYKDHQTIYF